MSGTRSEGGFALMFPVRNVRSDFLKPRSSGLEHCVKTPRTRPEMADLSAI
jgi:hypothetical protein